MAKRKTRKLDDDSVQDTICPIFKFEQGDKVKHIINGFTGVVVARTQWYNGCVQYGIASKGLDKDGRALESVHFDEEYLEIVSGSKPIRSTKTGGPSRPIQATN